MVFPLLHLTDYLEFFSSYKPSSGNNLYPSPPGPHLPNAHMPLVRGNGMSKVQGRWTAWNAPWNYKQFKVPWAQRQQTSNENSVESGLRTCWRKWQEPEPWNIGKQKDNYKTCKCKNYRNERYEVLQKYLGEKPRKASQRSFPLCNPFPNTSFFEHSPNSHVT